MLLIRKISLTLIVVYSLAFSIVAVANSQTNEKTNLSAEKQLQALLESDWTRMMNYWPEFANYLGTATDEQNKRWQNVSLQSYKEKHHQDKNVLTTLANINRGELSEASQLNYDLFKWQYQMMVDEFQYSPHLIPITQLRGVQSLDDFVNFVPLNSANDYKNWLIRLNKIPELIDQNIELMQEGIRKGIVPPLQTMSRLPGQIEKQIVDKPEESLYYRVFSTFPDSLSASEQQEFQQQAKSVISKKLVPAYNKLLGFFNDKYLPACRKEDGVSSLPNGKAYYEYLVRYFTTTELTPDEIHQIGLQEVARNRAEMDKVIKEVNFKGSFQEFIHFLRTDPQFYYKTSEELFNAYLAVSKRLDPEVVHLFGKLPRAPYGLKAIPDAVAPDETTAYYNGPAADGSRAGMYFVNLYKPETRPKYEMEVLSVHEAVPGHHLQIALQMELGELPKFRRFLGFTVFTEGWGLYSERLGYDMGLYKDPYSRFGQLTYDMWRAVRLVVDTGIHYKGWSRQKAIDYFKENAAKSEQDITNEIDRYISWPGQALAYKIGQLKFIELRDKSKEKLGEQFDIKAFHDIVLGQGAVPLNVLENNVDKWLVSQSD